MDMECRFVIPLEKYGAEGSVTMSAPTIRRAVELKNMIGRMARINGRDHSVDLSQVDAGDMEVLGVLVYVEEAPFSRTVPSFLEFCDTLDKGRDRELFSEMERYAECIDKGECSPLPGSQEAETQNSERGCSKRRFQADPR